MTPQIKSTRLSFYIRKELETRKAQPNLTDAMRHRAERAAALLDRAVFSLGTKKEGIAMLTSYKRAAVLYKEITGKDYVAPK